MSNVRHITVQQDDDGQRLDRWLKKNLPEIPYVLAQKLMRQGQIRIDGKRAKTQTRLSAGQIIRIPPVSSREDTSELGERKRSLTDADANWIRSLVIYDDGDVIALNKPQNISVQGGTNTKRHIDGMLEALKNKEGVVPRLVHRLDKDTSGILLLARSAKVARELGQAFKGRNVKKIYWAIVTPAPTVINGKITAPIGKSTGAGKEKMIVDEKEGKSALTEFSVIETAGLAVAFVAFWPRTGRTHQIRVHAQVMGSSILGDGKYKAIKDPESKRVEDDLNGLGLSKKMHLHARRIILKHPSRPGKLDITAPLGVEMTKTWRTLGFDPNYSDDPFVDMN